MKGASRIRDRLSRLGSRSISETLMSKILRNSLAIVQIGSITNGKETPDGIQALHRMLDSSLLH